MCSGFQTSLLFLQLLLRTKKKFLATSTLMNQAFTRCRPQLYHVKDPLDCTLHLFGLTFFWKFCFCYKINFIPSKMY